MRLAEMIAILGEASERQNSHSVAAERKLPPREKSQTTGHRPPSTRQRPRESALL